MMTQKKSRIKCPSLGLTLAAHALREALEEQRVILPVTLEELQGLCARERPCGVSALAARGDLTSPCALHRRERRHDGG